MGRPFNAEEAVLPVRTVVILIGICLGATGLFWSARGQWDETQSAIQTAQASINLLSKEQVDFRASLADLILKKGAERDAQFGKVNATLTDLGNSLNASVIDLNTKIAGLNDKIAALRANADGSHDETVSAIGQIKLQIENIMRDMAVMKCRLPGSECQKVKP
jgi:outer membrane murein-binding lipoprotein Lpp